MTNSLALGVASLIAGVALTVAAVPASAQQGASMPGMNMSSSANSGSSASTAAFKEADDKMMKQMSGPMYTGDADKDFVAHMIPHHQGAIDMANVELKYGKDPELKKLARSIVKAQHDEIGFMQKWQAKHAGK
ncbi:CopM family metallochaperone [Paraburkholderia strydomiana]|uniref:CopM family metallochaperone n=1 Tax=Paraburkholderia strydomiana TaxID=1245417 RepID=UPI0038B72E8E